MDRNAEIYQNAIDYSFSVYVRANETKEQFIKEYGDQIKAIQYLRNRGLPNQALNNNEPEASNIQQAASKNPIPKQKKLPVKSNQETLF